ncbi:MAG TPA: hypothetical protein VF221_03585 [Chloroflexota bacterium]
MIDEQPRVVRYSHRDCRGSPCEKCCGNRHLGREGRATGEWCSEAPDDCAESSGDRHATGGHLALAVLLTQSTPGTKQQCLYSGLAYVQLARDVRIAQSFHLTQHQHALMAPAELTECDSDGFSLFARLHPLMRAALMLRQGGHIFVGKRADALFASERINREVPGDAEKPASKCAARLERVDARHSARQGLLADILSVFAARHQVAAEAIQGLGVSAQQYGEGFLVPELEAANQIGIGQLLKILDLDSRVHTIPTERPMRSCSRATHPPQVLAVELGSMISA